MRTAQLSNDKIICTREMQLYLKKYVILCYFSYFSTKIQITKSLNY